MIIYVVFDLELIKYLSIITQQLCNSLDEICLYTFVCIIIKYIIDYYLKFSLNVTGIAKLSEVKFKVYYLIYENSIVIFN